MCVDNVAKYSYTKNGYDRVPTPHTNGALHVLMNNRETIVDNRLRVSATLVHQLKALADMKGFKTWQRYANTILADHVVSLSNEGAREDEH